LCSILKRTFLAAEEISSSVNWLIGFPLILLSLAKAINSSNDPGFLTDKLYNLSNILVFISLTAALVKVIATILLKFSGLSNANLT